MLFWHCPLLTKCEFFFFSGFLFSIFFFFFIFSFNKSFQHFVCSDWRDNAQRRNRKESTGKKAPKKARPAARVT